MCHRIVLVTVSVPGRHGRRGGREAPGHRRADEQAAVSSRRGSACRWHRQGHGDRVDPVGEAGRVERAQVRPSSGVLDTVKRRHRRGAVKSTLAVGIRDGVGDRDLLSAR